jgi:Tol biopolymer transport system component
VVIRSSRMMVACAVAWILGVIIVVSLAAALAHRGSTGASLGPAAHRNGLIAFAAVHASASAIYTVQPDGSGLHRLPLPAALGPIALAWSPDGRQIAFAATNFRAQEDSNLYLVQADGHGLRQLTHGLFGVSNVTWSPDGQWIAFAGWVHLTPVRLTPAAFAIRVTGTGLHPILTGFTVRSLAWGPGGLLAFSGTPSPASARWQGNVGVWTASVTGGDLRQVAGPLPLPEAFGTQLTVWGWSPDGRSLLIQDAPRYGELSVVPASGGRPHVILDCPMQTCTVIAGTAMGAPPLYRNDILSVAWSPDGGIIVCAVRSAAGDSFYTIPAAGGRLAPLGVPGTTPRSIGGLSWQPA